MTESGDVTRPPASPREPPLDRLTTRRWSPARAEALEELGYLPEVVEEFVYLALDAAPNDTVAVVIRRLRIPHRTLSRQMAAAGLAAPHLILRACRLLKAGFILIFERTTVERTAERIGFAKAATMRRHLVEDFGVLPSTLRSSGGVHLWPDVIKAFVKVVVLAV